MRRHRLVWTVAIASIVTFAAFAGLAGCVHHPEACADEFCVELFSSGFEETACDDGTDCVYAEVFFVAQVEGSHINDLGVEDVQLVLDDREVGVEGAGDLTQDNDLIVRLLLDASYSITEAGAEEAVRSSAMAFVDYLPDEARIAVAIFASEDEVPIFLDLAGTNTSEETYHDQADARRVIEEQYRAKADESSLAFTKLYDAVTRWSEHEISSQYGVAQPVMVVFTDGQDNWSQDFDNAQDARDHLDSVAPSQKIYGLGLGDGVDEDALQMLSEGRYYSAASAGDLQEGFENIADELSSIYQYRSLVPEVAEGVSTELRVSHGGEEVAITFEMGPSSKADEASGCSCDAGGQAGSSVWIAALFALAFVGVRRAVRS